MLNLQCEWKGCSIKSHVLKTLKAIFLIGIILVFFCVILFFIRRHKYVSVCDVRFLFLLKIKADLKYYPREES